MKASSCGVSGEWSWKMTGKTVKSSTSSSFSTRSAFILDASPRGLVESARGEAVAPTINNWSKKAVRTIARRRVAM